MDVVIVTKIYRSARDKNAGTNAVVTQNVRSVEELDTLLRKRIPNVRATFFALSTSPTSVPLDADIARMLLTTSFTKLEVMITKVRRGQEGRGFIYYAIQRKSDKFFLTRNGQWVKDPRGAAVWISESRSQLEKIAALAGMQVVSCSKCSAALRVLKEGENRWGRRSIQHAILHLHGCPYTMPDDEDLVSSVVEERLARGATS